MQRSNEYDPNCYSELLHITNGEETLELLTNKSTSFSFEIADFGCYLDGGEPLLFLERNSQYSDDYDNGIDYLRDYFRGAKYIGSYVVSDNLINSFISPWRKFLSKKEVEPLNKIFFIA